MTNPARHHRALRRGTVLIVAMIVIFALASLVLTLGRSVRVEAMASSNQLAAFEAAAIARGAEQYVIALLTEERDTLNEIDESQFEQVSLGKGYFWILRPDYGDSVEGTFGVLDESCKIDLNTCSYERLQQLPGMTDELAGSIVDWRDEDDDITASGAESQTYLQDGGYRAKNAAFESVEEMLLLRGMTRDLLYGAGTTVPIGQSSGLISVGDGTLYGNEKYQVRGLFQYFTVHARSGNMDSDGNARINVNDQGQRDQLRQLLRDTFGQTRGNQLSARIPQQGNIADSFDFALRLQMTASELGQVEDRISTTNAEQSAGRINVNTAPREVLLTIPNLETSDVDALISQRPAPQSTDKPASTAWVLDVLRQKAIGIGNAITGAGTRFSADIVAVSGNGRAFKRIRLIVDAEPTPVRVLYRRDITDRGWPMDPGILQALRSGQQY